MNIIQSREQAFQALFDRLSAVPGMVTCTRKLKHWQDVPPEEQPALYMAHDGEVRSPVRGLPDRVVLEGSLYLYVSTNGEAVGPTLNPLLDAIDGAFAPANDGDHTQTLGGIVHHCWIEGQTQIFEGNLGTEAVAIIPFKILVT